MQVDQRDQQELKNELDQLMIQIENVGIEIGEMDEHLDSQMRPYNIPPHEASGKDAPSTQIGNHSKDASGEQVSKS